MQYQSLVALADGLRDQRRFIEAARAYESALSINGRDPDIWIQLGNMLKDSNDLTGAESAYRRSLALNERSADCHVQLGRALRLQGRREEALEAFSKALRLDFQSRDAALELVDLGEYWRVQQQSGLGVSLQHELLSTVRELKRSLRDLETKLPAITSLSTVVRQRYDLFRSLYRDVEAPVAPGTARLSVALVMFDCDMRGSRLIRAMDDLRSSLDVRVLAITRSPEAVSHIRRASHGSACPQTPFLAEPGLSDVSALTEVVSKVSHVDWVVVSRVPIHVSGALASWLGWTASETDAVAAYVDEDEADPLDPRGELRCNPMLKASLDCEDENLAAAVGSTLAVRLPFLLEVLQNRPLNASDWWKQLIRHLWERGPIAHIPRILVSRLGPLPNDLERCKVPSSPRPRISEATRIGVIVPTKNQHMLLAACIKSLRAKAVRSDLLDICVVDNQSDDPAAIALIDGLVKAGEVHSFKYDEPFNWARINNLAARETGSDILIFANNDVEMLADAWDDHVRAALALDDVGAVGACLLYPDYTVQHGGMVLGMANISEHEGRNHPIREEFWDNRLERRRTVGAVTGAFLACRRTVFSEVDGFDEANFPIAFNDVDFCLKVRSRGYRVVYEPLLRGLHYESQSLRVGLSDEYRSVSFGTAKRLLFERWGVATGFDPGFNPYFARCGRPFEYLREPSVGEILDYVRRSTAPRPWCIEIAPNSIASQVAGSP